MNRTIYALKSLPALIGLVMLGGTADAQTYSPANYNASSCATGYTIERVATSGGIYNINNNNSGCGATSGYTYYASPGTQGLVARQGNSITLTMRNGAAGAQFFMAWVDFNDDGDYVDAGEQVYANTIAASATASGTFTIPMTASVSTTRIRVRTTPGGSSTSLNSTNLQLLGEAEDYDVTILSSVIPGCDTVTNINASNITLTSADISWTAPATGHTQYETHIDQTPTGPTGSGYNPVTTNNITYNNLLPSTCYWVHIRTNCDPLLHSTTTSDWVNMQFCTVQDCEQPKVTIDRITGTTAIASWDPVPTVYAYEYAVSTTPTPPVTGTMTTYTSVQLLGLAPNKTLYFHLRAKCNPTPQSLWRTTPFHTTVGTSVGSVNGEDFSVSAYPNPVQNKLFVTVDGRIANSATVSLTDMTGKQVYNNTINGDTEIDMNGLPKGVYMLKYTDGQHYSITKVLKN